MYTFSHVLAFIAGGTLVRVRKKDQEGQFGVTVGDGAQEVMHTDLLTRPLEVSGQKFRIVLGSLGVIGWAEVSDPINRAAFRVKSVVPRGMLGQDLVLHAGDTAVWSTERAGVLQTHRGRRALVEITTSTGVGTKECVEGEVQFMVGTNRCILMDVVRAFGQEQGNILSDLDLNGASVQFKYVCAPGRRMHLLYPDVCGEYRQPVFPTRVLDPLDGPKREKKHAQILACISRSSVCATGVIYRCGREFAEGCTATFTRDGRFELRSRGGKERIQPSIGCRIFFHPDRTNFQLAP